MDDQPKLEVKVISTETLKPSSPTPPHKKSFNLSFIDQAFPCVHTTFCLVYNNNNNNNNSSWSETLPSGGDIISSLKASLSKTLTAFYPLAGRFENESTISCNDQGALFIETQVNCPVSAIFKSADYYTKLSNFLPPSNVLHGGGGPINEIIPLVFQINVFHCGGIIIGCYMIHKLLDAVSMSTFLNHWATLASNIDMSYDDDKNNNNNNNDLSMMLLSTKPDFSATNTAFPPVPRNFFTDLSPNISTLHLNNDHHRVVAKGFVFNKVTIDKLKIKAASEKLPYPTGFESISALIWQHAFVATNPNTISICSFPANIRSRILPPLSNSTIGNLFTMVHSVSDKNINSHVYELPQLAANIHDAKIVMVDEKIDELQRIGVRALVVKQELEIEKFVEKVSFHVSSWCKLGFSEVNFGFGKPNRIIPVALLNPVLKNHVFLVDYVDVSGDLGVQAWLFLEEKHMKLLEFDSKFCEFTFPI